MRCIMRRKGYINYIQQQGCALGASQGLQAVSSCAARLLQSSRAAAFCLALCPVSSKVATSHLAPVEWQQVGRPLLQHTCGMRSCIKLHLNHEAAAGRL